MADQSPLSKAAIAELAALMGLRFGDDEIERMEAEVRSVARNIAKLDALDLDGVEPALIHFVPPNVSP